MRLHAPHGTLFLTVLLGLGSATCGGDDDVAPDDAGGEDAVEAEAAPDAPDTAEDGTLDGEPETGPEADAEAEAEVEAETTLDVPDVPDPDCIERAEPPLTGSHYAGQDCMTCHNGLSASRFTVAGTLYGDAWGSARLAGGTIVVVGDDGTELRLVTDDLGNFSSEAAVRFPATVRASRCPRDRTMPEPASGGSCNRCHIGGSRINLP